MVMHPPTRLSRAFCPDALKQKPNTSSIFTLALSPFSSGSHDFGKGDGSNGEREVIIVRGIDWGSGHAISSYPLRSAHPSIKHKPSCFRVVSSLPKLIICSSFFVCFRATHARSTCSFLVQLSCVLLQQPSTARHTTVVCNILLAATHENLDHRLRHAHSVRRVHPHMNLTNVVRPRHAPEFDCIPMFLPTRDVQIRIQERRH